MGGNDESVGTITSKSSSAYFQWEIPNYCISCRNVGNSFLSPEFTTSFIDINYWKLRLYNNQGPQGENDKNKNWLALYLHYLGTSTVTANIKFSILDDEYRKVEEVNLKECIFDSFDHTNWGSDELIEKKKILDKKNKILMGGNLKILCEIIFKSDYIVPELISTMNSSSDKVDVPAYRLQALDDFERFFEKELHSDVTITIGKSKIQAHKAIIISRSPVFDAMFKHDTREKEENIIEITDVSYEVMKEVLRFMYASKVNDIQKIASDLLVAAEKYDVGGLKTLCEQTLHKNLNMENAIEILKLSDMYNATNLKQQAIEFIVSNQKAITEKPEFELFGHLHSKLQCDLIRAIVAENLT